MLEIKNVSKSYDKTDNVIDSVNLKIENGEIFGFLGPNGAGKTTLIKMMTGILEIDKGSIEIDYTDISKEPVKAKIKFGYVSDDSDTFLNLSGIEYLNFMADIYKVSKDVRLKNIEYYARKFSMMDALGDKIQNYSHGMRQKINIIAVLITEPQNLILDEPITGLDPTSIYELKNVMVEYGKLGKTVFFSTHILSIAERLCDRVAIIKKGEIKYVGTVEELKVKSKSDDTLENIFMELMKQ